MLVSVIVPVYNVENYVSKCLESLINQTYNDIEIICVNDGSTDGSLGVLNAYSIRDNRVLAYTKENGGLSDARNYGLSKAHGKYVLFVDSDDYIDLTTVEKCIDKINLDDSEIVVFDMKYIYDTREEYASGGKFKCSCFKDNRNIIFINNSACNKFIKKELMNGVEFPKGLYYEDLATIPILLSKAKKISKIDEPLYFYIQRGSSIAHTISDKIFDIYKAIDLISKYYSNHELDKEIEKLYVNHGLLLTVLRIKDNSDDIITYLKKNNACLDQYFPRWRNIFWFNGYSIKNNLIFKLLQNNQFDLVRKAYHK